MTTQRWSLHAGSFRSALVFAVALSPAAGLAAEAGVPAIFPDLAQRILRPLEIPNDFIALSPADFDGDGRVDLAGPTRWAGLAFLRRDGEGWTWRGWPTVDLDQDWAWSAAADFDGDGLRDLVYLEGCMPFLWFGSSEDGLVQGPEIHLGGEGACTGALAAGDFDGDELSDLAELTGWIGPDEQAVEVLQVHLGRSDRALAEGARLRIGPAGSVARGMAARDLDGDGALDLAFLMATAWDGPIHLYTLDGKGDGTFELRSETPIDGEPRPLAVGDVNGDGKPDVVLPLPEESLVRVLIGKSDGTFEPGPSAMAFRPEGVACADLDGDGEDEILAPGEDGTLAVLGADGAGGLARASLRLGGGRLATPIADVDGDGRLDVVLFDEKGLMLLRGNGDGSLVAPRAFPAYSPDLIAGDMAPWAILQERGRGCLAVDDVDGDRVPDLLWLRSGAGRTVELAVAAGKGDGSFRIPTAFKVADNPSSHLSSFALADLDLDGAKDILFAEFGAQFPDGAGALFLFPGGGDGTFRRGPTYEAGMHPFLLAVGSLDADAFDDVAVASYEGLVSVLLGGGDGTLRPGKVIQIGRSLADLAMGDFDGDRSRDLALATLEPRPELLLILFGDGGGGFERRDFPGHYHTFREPLHGVDLGDGFDSLFAMALDLGGFGRFAFLGREPRAVEQVLGVWASHPAAAFADLDGDGAKDMLLSGREELEVFLSRTGRQPGEPAFEPASLASPSDRGAWDVAVADLDGDARLDVVTLGRSIVVHRNALEVQYIRGDAFDDGKIDITDPIAILQYLFHGTGGRGPRCRDAWDSNGDGGMDISDAVYLLLFLYMGGDAPPAPFPGCGSAPGAGLGCGAHAACR